jgi:hypothetical protein
MIKRLFQFEEELYGKVSPMKIELLEIEPISINLIKKAPNWHFNGNTLTSRNIREGFNYLEHRQRLTFHCLG